jgi:hypothetical protein
LLMFFLTICSFKLFVWEALKAASRNMGLFLFTGFSP